VTTDSRIDIFTIAGAPHSGGAAVAQTQFSDPGAPEAASATEPRHAVTQPSWESACACPQLCLRDHERD
jgi:hypothetical protein